MSTNFPHSIMWAIRLSNLILPGYGISIEREIDHLWGNPPLLREVAGRWDDMAGVKVSPLVQGVGDSANRLGDSDRPWRGQAYTSYSRWVTQWQNESLWKVRDCAYVIRDALLMAARSIEQMQGYLISVCTNFTEAIGGAALVYLGTKLPPPLNIADEAGAGVMLVTAVRGLFKDVMGAHTLYDTVLNDSTAKMKQALNVPIGYKSPASGKIVPTKFVNVNVIEDWKKWEG
ncbi:MAG: WXG100 family type VII secretion target [Actinoallomurus sp.]